MNIQIINDININDNNINIKSKQIICREFGENIRIKFNEFKIKLHEYQNWHNINDILLDKFENTQYINESKIIYDECKHNNKMNHIIKYFIDVINTKWIYVLYVKVNIIESII